MRLGSRLLRDRRRGERGADLVEAALVLPILLTIIFALYSLGRGWDIYQTMTRAAREGVRRAVTTGCATCSSSGYDSTTTIQDIVDQALGAAGIDSSKVENYTQGYKWLDNSNSVCGAYIKFSYPYNIVIPFVPVPVTSITLSTNVQMRLENATDISGGTCP